MNEKGFRYVGLAAAVIAGAVVKAALQPSPPAQFNAQQAVQTSAQTVEKLETDARAHHPGVSENEAVRLEAVAQASAKIKSAPEAERSQTAASQFLGYYYANTTMYTQICQGVDISPYVEAFQGEHSDLLRRAHEIMAKSGISPAQVDAAMPSVASSMKPLLTQRISEIPSVTQPSLRQGCQILSARGAALAHAQLMSTVNPDVYRAIVQD